MKLGNRRGFADVVLIGGMLVLSLLIWVAGPSLIKSVGTLTSGGDKNQNKMVHRIDSTRTLYTLDPVTNKMAPVKDTYSEYSTQAISEQPPETLWTKFLHLGIMIIPIIALISWAGAWPLVKRWTDKIKANVAAATGKHDTLNAQVVDIIQATDDGWDAFDARVAVYQALVDGAADPTIKANNTAIVLALKSAKQAMKDKMYAEMDNDSWAKLAELQAVAPSA
jgi:competence protein ComGC